MNDVVGGQDSAAVAKMLELMLARTRDAVLVVRGGVIRRSSRRAGLLLGGDLSGRALADVVDPPAASATAGVVEGIPAQRLDGDQVVVDVETALLGNTAEQRDEGLQLVFLVDSTGRLEREALRAAEELRRRQALEINDTVVQGLAAALLALEQDKTQDVRAVLERTMVSSRGIMDDLLDPHNGIDLGAGDLVRASASQSEDLLPVPTTRPLQSVEAPAAPAADLSVGAPAAPATSGYRVLVVDDAEDLRELLCLRMRARESLTVVGEAADGVTAVEQASRLQPDLVLLDLAMPLMDGLQALPLIKQVAPDTRVIVLSGFNQSAMEEKALAAGADLYLVKGGSVLELIDHVETVLAG